MFFYFYVIILFLSKKKDFKLKKYNNEININIIDNLFSTSEIPKYLDNFIHKTVIDSLEYSNTNSEYSPEII